MNKSIDVGHEFSGHEAQQSTRNFLHVLWQRKAFVILGACVGLALGFLWHTQKPTIFSSMSQVLVVQRNAPKMLPSGANSGPNMNSLVEDYMATHLVLMKSPLIIERAWKVGKLDSLKSFEGVSDYISAIQGNITVTRDMTKETSSQPNNIVVLTYRSIEAEDCKKVLDAIVNSYQEFLDITYRNVSDQTLELINKARDTLKGDLQLAEDRYSKFREEAEYWTNQKGFSVEQERVAVVEAKRSQLLLQLTDLNTKVATLKDAIDKNIGDQVLGYDTFAKSNNGKEAKNQFIKQPLIDLVVKLAGLRVDFGPDHPEVKALELKIEKMQEQLELIAPAITEREPARVMLNALRFESDNIKGNIRAMDEMLVVMKADTRKLNTFENQEMRLRKDMARTEAIYDSTLKRLQEINLVRDQGGFDARVLTPPRAGAKVSPVLFNDLAMFLMLGLMVGGGLAYLADVADKSFRSPDEIRKQMGLPLVGHIPYFAPDADSTARRAAGESTIDPMLCCYFKPKSLDSEAYRAVRTSLFFSTQGQGLKVIQVTSPNKGDGKSLLISNLAVTTAQSGKRVLLIDADCRRPRQHKVFNVPNDTGLATVLNGACTPADAIHESVVPGLSIMGSGPIPPNPSELLVSPRFKELLDSFRAHYDYIFVDSPPLLAVTDPCIVAGKVDGLFLAIRLTRKGRPDAERAREILSSLNVRTFGIVVNGVTRTNGGLYSAAAYDYSDKYINYEAEEDKAYYYADDDDDLPKE